MKRISVIPVLLVLAGCNEITFPCEADLRAGILLKIVDSATQGPVLVDSIVVRATDRSFVDRVRFTNLRPDPVTDIALAMEREGTYDLEVVATGYRVWEQDRVRVGGDRCHVKTVRVTASLQRVSSVSINGH